MDGGTPLRVEQLVIEQAKRRPEHVALCFGTRRWTYAWLSAEMERRAARLMPPRARCVMDGSRRAIWRGATVTASIISKVVALCILTSAASR